MAKFLYDSDLNAELEKIIREAEEYILLISPYIKLHPRIKSLLESKKSTPGICLIIVFGKNEDSVDKSMSKEEFDFFKSFPNIEIRHESRLHAKYFASEKGALLTSMNLYEFSQNNNIEFGISLKTNRLKDFANAIIGTASLDDQAFQFFVQRVVDQSTPIYINEPIFENGFMGFGSKYLRSEVREDNSDKFFRNEVIKKTNQPVSHWKKPSPVQPPKQQAGYCIRTGKPIAFNPKRPMSDEAYQSWAKFSNPDYAEKYCHFSGEPSNGETTFAKPILKKNWQKAKEAHKM
jgi:hypothetical protein